MRRDRRTEEGQEEGEEAGTGRRDGRKMHMEIKGKKERKRALAVSVLSQMITIIIKTIIIMKILMIIT